MAGTSELGFVDAVGLGVLVRQREIKPIELVEGAIDRIEKLNGSLNAVVTPMYDLARGLASGESLQGPFAGVPYLLKDLRAYYAGVEVTSGSAFLRDFVPDHDSELVIRLKRAGLIVVGRTSTPELGLLPTTEPRLYGPCRNPWDTTRIAGGSSGGSAVAVASGMVPMAHGTDAGGSIRIPASCCGLFGMKPTRARNPHGPDSGDVLSGMVSEHAVTRSVRDSAALLDATSGPDLGDPYCAPPRARPYIEELGRDPGRLIIGFTSLAPDGSDIHQDCVDAVLDAAHLCASLGHHVEEGSPEVNMDMLNQAWMTMVSAGVVRSIEGSPVASRRVPSPELFEPGTWAMYELGKSRTAADYLQAVGTIQSISRQVARFFVNHDMWLSPTVAEPPTLLGTFTSPVDSPFEGRASANRFAPFTRIFNATGQPGMSVPLFWNRGGLPVGVHFAGRFGDEAILFRLAAQLEQARPWGNRISPISA